ncbi:methyltransferase domain-containing protein [bacterium]|nr:methyltransferase domain-containing protein [bacterium]
MPSDAAPVVYLRKRRAQPFLNRHPWVFAGAIQRIDGEPADGDEVIVRSDDGHFVALGLFNAQSNIRVRLYSWHEDQPIDESLLRQRIDDAVTLRDGLFDTEQNSACRLIFSEADGLSGLTVDRYSDWLLVQLTSLALATRSDLLFDLLEERCQPRGIWLRTEKGIRKLEGLEQSDGLIRGEEPPRPLHMRENGLMFLVDVAEGQKTGSYLDQRDNRRAAAAYVRGGQVLDLFCYAGGFGITAAKLGNAQSVVCVDSSEPALETARQNAAENGVGDRVEFVRSDVFRFLEAAVENDQQFDTVILDPPKLARHQKGVDSALRGYRSLNELAAQVVRPGGTLVTCSCSGQVGRAEFQAVLARVSTTLDRPIQILEVRGHAPDHPVSPNCPENEYLKCLICRIV